MKNRTLIGSTILALTLLAAATSFAEETSPAAAPAEQNAAQGRDFHSKMANMTPEQRQAKRAEMKAKYDSMTPEQKEKFKAERMEHKAEHMKHRAERMEHRADMMKQHAEMMQHTDKVEGAGK
jgi:phage shock protein A